MAQAVQGETMTACWNISSG